MCNFQPLEIGPVQGLKFRGELLLPESSVLKPSDHRARILNPLNCCNIFMETKLKFDAIIYMYIVGNIPGNYAC